MFDLKTLSRAIQQLAEEKNIPENKILEAVESSLAAAYKKEYEKKGEMVRAHFNLKTGDTEFYLVKIIVDETTVDITAPMTSEEAAALAQQETRKPRRDEVVVSVAPPVEGEEEKLPRYNPDRHITLEEAHKIKKDAQLGEEITFLLEARSDFGRIASQVAKQVILQKIREAERESVLGEFRGKEGEIVSGIVQRFDRGNVFVDLGRATGIMFYNESIPGEHYRISDRMRFYVLAVQDDPRGPGIILSRAYPNFVVKLFSLEAPEIADGTVEIKALAREAGSRTKIAVVSHVDGVDPVGCCVGQRGTRVMAVSNELGQEKIDIVEWSEDPVKFVTSSLSPAKVRSVEIMPRREARAFVASDQLSLAIGKGGQNVRLAAKITGWKIDVRSQEKPEEAIESGQALPESTASGSTNDLESISPENIQVKEEEPENS